MGMLFNAKVVTAERVIEGGSVQQDRGLLRARRRRDGDGDGRRQPLLGVDARGTQSGECARVIRQFAEVGSGVFGDQVVEQLAAEHVRTVGLGA